LLGLISIEVRGELVMVTVVEPLTPSPVAEIVADPDVTAVADLLSLMKRTSALEVVHTTDVSTLLVPSP
jgi:hypothetical protein